MLAVPGWAAHHFRARRQHTGTFARAYAPLLYLWLFGVLETVVARPGMRPFPAAEP